MTTDKKHQDNESYLNKEFFTKALQQYLGESEVTVLNVEISMGCDNGDNYCSIVYRVLVEYKKSNGKLDKVTWIVKSMPNNPERSVLKDMQLYQKEKDMYFDVLPKMEKCMNANFAPRCFYATSEPEETMILQDLKCVGLKLVNRDVTLDEEHCAVVLRKLGQFHAASMFLQEKDPNSFANFTVGTFNSTYLQHPQMVDFFLSTYKAALRLVKEWPDFKDIASKMEKLEATYLEKTSAVFDSKDASFKVLNHGDLWSNNIFFKYDMDDKTPVDCILIDFQGCVFTSPGIDLNYFMNISMQLKVVRSKRDYVLKEYYYKSLKESCEKLGVHHIPSYDCLEKEIREKEFFGLFAAIGSSLICMGKDATQDMSVDRLLDNTMGEIYRDLACREAKFQTKMRYLLRRADDVGLLD